MTRPNDVKAARTLATAARNEVNVGHRYRYRYRQIHGNYSHTIDIRLTMRRVLSAPNWKQFSALCTLTQITERVQQTSHLARAHKLQNYHRM